jgi:hypothetical protein
MRLNPRSALDTSIFKVIGAAAPLHVDGTKENRTHHTMTARLNGLNNATRGDGGAVPIGSIRATSQQVCTNAALFRLQGGLLAEGIIRLKLQLGSLLRSFHWITIWQCLAGPARTSIEDTAAYEFNWRSRLTMPQERASFGDRSEEGPRMQLPLTSHLLAARHCRRLI